MNETLSHWANTKPPLGSQADLAHPLCPNGLAVLLNENGGPLVNDLVQRRAGTYSGNTGVAGANTIWGKGITNSGGRRWAGPALSFVSGNLDVMSFGNASLIVPTTAATVILGYRKRDATNRASGAFGIASESGTNIFGAHLPYNDGTVYWDFGGTTSGTTRLTKAGLTFGDDVWAFTTGPRGMEIWQNGILQASNAATPTRTATTNALELGAHNGAACDSADFFFFLIYQSQFAKGAIAAISADPFGFVLAPTYRRWLKVAAAAPAAGPRLIQVVNDRTLYEPELLEEL